MLSRWNGSPGSFAFGRAYPGCRLGPKTRRFARSVETGALAGALSGHAVAELVVVLCEPTISFTVKTISISCAYIAG
jgi:hypothetical protein